MCNRKVFALAITAFFITCGLLSYPPESAARQKVIRYAHIAPPHTPMGKSAEFFKTYVEKNTGGSIKVEIYPFSQLGGARALMDQLMTGTLDIGFVMSPVLATLMPEFNVLNLPFVVPNVDVMRYILWTEDFKDKLDGVIRKKGMIPIFICDVAPRGFLNTKRPVRTPDDVKGLSMRVMEGPIYSDMFTALGARTRTMPFGEVYTALQQGVIDAEDNSLGMAVAMKFVEVEKFFTPFNQTMLVGYVLGSQRMWNSLTETERRVISEFRAPGEIYGTVAVAKDDSAAIEIATREHGVKIEPSLSSSEIEAFREKVKDVVSKYRTIVGPDIYDHFLKLAQFYELSRAR